jgi:hypothetical protein
MHAHLAVWFTDETIAACRATPESIRKRGAATASVGQPTADETGGVMARVRGTPQILVLSL